MLQQADHDMVPGAVDARQADQHQRQPRAHVERQCNGDGVDGRPDTGDADRLRPLLLGNEGLLGRADDAGGVAQHVAHCVPDIAHAEEGQHHAHEIRRPHDRYFGIATDDDGVGVVAGMAPAPGDRVAHDHEAGDLIDHVVHPLRAEGGAMAAFVPARIRRRAVEHTVGEEEWHAPPGAPEEGRAGSGHQDGAQPDRRIAQGRIVGALHELLHLLARQVGVVPFGSRQSGFDGELGIAADQTVVPPGWRCGHDFLHRNGARGRTPQPSCSK